MFSAIVERASGAASSSAASAACTASVESFTPVGSPPYATGENERPDADAAEVPASPRARDARAPPRARIASARSRADA